MAKPQTTSTTLTPSWSLVPKNFQLLRPRIEQIVTILLLPILAISLGSILMPAHSTHFTIGWVVIVIGFLWWLVNIAATYYLQVSAAKNKIISTADLYRKSWRYFGRLIGFTIIFGIMLIVGFILLIVPGLIVLRRYILTSYYIVDKDLPIRQAMKLSAAQTKPVQGYLWGTLGVYLVLSLTASIFSLIFVFIPGATVIITTLLVPFYYFLLVLRYTEISDNSKITVD
jgi:hypothetical protein